MRGLCPKQSSGSGLAQSLWPLFLNFWNEIAQLKRNSIQDVALCFCCLLTIHFYLENIKKTVAAVLFINVCPSCFSFCFSNARLNYSSIQGPGTRGNWNVTPYPFTLQKCSEKQNIVLLPFPPHQPQTPSLPPSLLLQVCVCIFHYISVIISCPAGRNPNIRRFYSRAF